MKNLKVLLLVMVIGSGTFNSIVPVDNPVGSSNKYENFVRAIIKEYDDLKVAVLKTKGAYDLTSGSGAIKKVYEEETKTT